jgi:PAS domain S-box-containing protein
MPMNMVSKSPASGRAVTPVADISDARLRALTEYALEIITVQNANGQFTYVNEAVAGHLGHSVIELIGKNAADFIHPEELEMMRERFRRLLDAPESQPRLDRFEYRFRHKNGGWCWLEGVAVNALTNPAVHGIIVHSRDISRRKESERGLLLNHARYRTVADLSEGAVYEYLMNASGGYELEWSFGTERVYGCSEEEYRRRGWQSFLVGEDSLAHSHARAERYLRGEIAEFTAQIRRADRRSGDRQVFALGGCRHRHHRAQAGGRCAARE